MQSPASVSSSLVRLLDAAINLNKTQALRARGFATAADVAEMRQRVEAAKVDAGPEIPRRIALRVEALTR